MVNKFLKYVDQECPYCNAKTTTTSGYTSHIKYHCRKNPNSEWYKNHQKICPKCGKEFVGETKFCSRSCANGHIVTEEQKEKTRNTLLKTLEKNGYRGKPLKKYTIKESTIKESTIKKLTNEKRFCEGCGKEISWGNKYPYCNKCRPKYIPYSEEAKKKQSEVMKGKPRWHIHRNQSSFAETFFEKVLKNNKIDFKREVAIKKDDGIHCYFLDFLIEKNGKLIDLEIDGSQHQLPERLESDKIRDSFLKNKNYIVYRIQWNDIKSENGKLQMKEKINNFLLFLKDF